MRTTKPSKNKYRNRKVIVDGLSFDSILEAHRYSVLRSRLDAGEISDLRLQPRFTLAEGFRDLDGTYIRPVQYIADFSYKANGIRIVEDAKGFRTEGYTIKRKLLKDKYGLSIREITKDTVDLP